MTNIIYFPSRARIVTDQHRRIADRITELVQQAPNETICVCAYRDLDGDSACIGCPENPHSNPPEGES